MATMDKAIALRLGGGGVAIAYSGAFRAARCTLAVSADAVGLVEQSDVLIGRQPHPALVDGKVLAPFEPDGVLIEALCSRTILAADLDVCEDEARVPAALIDRPHVVLLPHVGSASTHTRMAMASCWSIISKVGSAKADRSDSARKRTFGDGLEGRRLGHG